MYMFVKFLSNIEKAAYPHYFARREQRKQEYLKRWQAKYATDPEKDLGITGYSPFGDVKVKTNI